MNKVFLALGFALTLVAAGAQAASVDLTSRKLAIGGSIFATADATIDFDGPFDVFVLGDPGLQVQVDGFPSDPFSATLFVAATGYLGGLEDFAFDLSTGMGEGLFFDAASATFALARVGFPAGLAQLPGPNDQFVQGGLSLEVFDLKVIPLPAALPLALASLGALIMVGRRRA